MAAKTTQPPAPAEEPLSPENLGPPEGIVETDDLAAEFGVATAQLHKARRTIMQLRIENEALRKANEKLAQALETKQTPAGAPAGSAPRSQRRPIELAERRAAAKAEAVAKRKEATGGNDQT